MRPPDYLLSTSSSLPTSRDSQDSTLRLKRRRTRSGCVTCRDRHIKCDERVPVCNNCLRLRRVCYRGLRLNFIQYNYYNPRKDSPGMEDSTVLPHRILDQSITIAALYNGLGKYRPYMHLHSQQDLEDSDLEYQDENYLPLNDPTLSQLPSGTSALEDTSKKRRKSKDMLLNLPGLSAEYTQAVQKVSEPSLTYSIQDAFDRSQQQQIEAQLPSLNAVSTQPYQMLSYANLPSIQATSPLRYTNLGIPQQKTNTLAYEPQHYINILDKEQFYWLLDQFNDYKIWQTIIPLACVNEKDNFLFSCLMNCSRDPTISDTIDLKFLIDFQNIKYNQVKSIEIVQTSSVSLFETLLISICLVLLGIYLKIPHGELTSFHKQVLNNQSNLFDQLLAKLFIYFMNMRSSEKSLIISSCIQSITILKFFMNKYYDLAFFQQQSTHTTNLDVEVSSFIKFNSYEINFLNTMYQSIDITSYPSTSPQPQVTNTVNINLAASPTEELRNSQFSNIATESRKLKNLIWYLIKLDYVINFPTETAQISTHTTPDEALDNQLQIITPEQLIAQCQATPPHNFGPIVRAILQDFTFKLLNMNNRMIIQLSNFRLRQFLEMNKHDGTELGLSELHCMHYFGWTLRYVNSS